MSERPGISRRQALISGSLAVTAPLLSAGARTPPVVGRPDSAVHQQLSTDGLSARRTGSLLEQVAIAAVAWGPNRLDLFGLGTDDAMYHKAWMGNGWQPQWEGLGGKFNSLPAVVAWGRNRLDVFGLGTDNAMYHKAWMNNSWQPQWEGLGGRFSSPPAVASWGANRLDVFGLGTDNSMYHKAWMGNGWQPQWEGLGGIFNIPPGP
jgi:hypothetical protein